MRTQITTLLLVLFLAFLASAVAPRKSVLVTYPMNTPSHIVEQAKEEIVKAGGIITHEYHLIQGFAADVAQKALDTVQSLGSEYNVHIEEDQVVSANSEHSGETR